MACIVPGGVVAGVVGTERVLLSPVSIDKGWFPCMFDTPGLPHSYELLELPIPMMLDALVGGVGNV